MRVPSAVWEQTCLRSPQLPWAPAAPAECCKASCHLPPCCCCAALLPLVPSSLELQHKHGHVVSAAGWKDKGNWWGPHALCPTGGQRLPHVCLPPHSNLHSSSAACTISLQTSDASAAPRSSMAGRHAARARSGQRNRTRSTLRTCPWPRPPLPAQQQWRRRAGRTCACTCPPRRRCCSSRGGWATVVRSHGPPCGGPQHRSTRRSRDQVHCEAATPLPAVHSRPLAPLCPSWTSTSAGTLPCTH